MKHQTIITYTLIVILSILSPACIKKNQSYIHYDDLSGPVGKTVIPDEKKDGWKAYDTGSPSRMALYLADKESGWTGIVHGLKTWGIPITVTRDLHKALQHTTVFLYPVVSGKTFTEQELTLIRAYVNRGGNLITGQVLGGGLQDVFGIENPRDSRTRHEVIVETGHPLTRQFIFPEEQTLRIANPERPATMIGTTTYDILDAAILARFNDGKPAITTSTYGKGKTMAWGFDPGFLFLKGYNDTDDEATRHYVNHYEPVIDVFARIIKKFYRTNSAGAITLGTVPFGKKLSVIISHDVDYYDSLKNSIEYAEYQQSEGIGATYFMQAKYFRDYFDKVFFDHDTGELMQKLRDMGMEIASHSVSHTDVFAILPLGEGDEAYPDYQPRVMAMKDTRGATILGELRVSKFLLEHFSESEIVSFRPGFLAYPKALPQALEGAGYRYSSSVAANNVMTHMPYRVNYNRNYRSQTGIYEFPIAIEDEKDPPMNRRIDQALELAHKLSHSGGLCVVLIHPNITGQKLDFLKKFVPKVKPFSWFGTLSQFGNWWVVRDNITVDTKIDGKKIFINLTVPGTIEGLVLEKNNPAEISSVEPADIVYDDQKDKIILEKASGTVSIVLKMR